MNKENIKKLIAYFENLDPSQYNQNEYISACGSPLCIAGHTVFLFSPKYMEEKNTDQMSNKQFSDYNNAIHYAAKDFLGLSYDQANKLFKPVSNVNHPKHAIAVLKNFLDTGYIYWGIIK